ncbi:MAG: serine hydrolase [Actinomycetota bacterium]|jgi:CubicO group peptidase (beta-lactamase class C family)|nr:serine hydrolase [Actinomycetota bacterium]
MTDDWAGALSGVAAWPVEAAVAVVGPGGTVATTGDATAVRPWASVTKLLTAIAVLVAVEEGTVGLDDPAGPPGATVGHLLAHASGLGPGSPAVQAPPATRRIYSNAGFELLGDVVGDAAGMPFGEYLRGATIEPLGLRQTSFDGSPAAGASGPLTDLARLGQELLAPTLLSPETMGLATSVAFPGLDGVLPGYGVQRPNDWGLGFELRDGKHPHWTGVGGSARTFGHFGRSGSFLWVDPDAGVACAELAAEPWGRWAVERWPPLADAVLAAARAG